MSATKQASSYTGIPGFVARHYNPVAGCMIPDAHTITIYNDQDEVLTTIRANTADDAAWAAEREYPGVVIE